MAGQLCDGRLATDAKNGVIQNSKAYCEGMSYRASDTALNAPITDNPHESGSEAADAWDAGWTVADDAAGGAIDKDSAGCCAAAGLAVSA